MADSFVLLSGGIDSMVCTSLLIDAGKEPTAVFVDYRQDAAILERRAATSISERFGIKVQSIDLCLGRKFGTGEITGRNLLLISSALSHAAECISEIVIGVHAGIPYYDCTPDFVKKLRVIVSECSVGKVTLVTPLISWTKPEIIRYALDHDLPLDITYSCERGSDPSCGECLSCKDREALEC